jgi:hypothetical protein
VVSVDVNGRATASLAGHPGDLPARARADLVAALPFGDGVEQLPTISLCRSVPLELLIYVIKYQRAAGSDRWSASGLLRRHAGGCRSGEVFDDHDLKSFAPRVSSEVRRNRQL